MALSARAGITLEWCFVGISFLFVLIRLYVRWWLMARISASDVFVIAAFGLYITLCAFDTIVYINGIWAAAMSFLLIPGLSEAAAIVHDPDKLRYILKLMYDSAIIYYSCLWCVKAALVLMYYQMVPAEMVKCRRWLNATSVFVGASWIVVLCLNAFWCLPVLRNWSLRVDEACWSSSEPRAYYASLAMHLTSDVGTFLLPFSLLQILQLSPRKRLGVAAMMALGTLCIVCAVGRAVTIRTTSDRPAVSVWASAEIAAAIAVTCCPSLKWLVKSFRGYYKAKREAEGEREEWGTYTWRKKTGIGSGNWIHELEDSDKDEDDGIRMAAFFVGRGGDEENFAAGEGPSSRSHLGMAGVRISREIEQKSEHEVDETERKEA